MENLYSTEAPLAGQKCFHVYQQRKSVCEICPTRDTFQTGLPQKKRSPHMVNGDQKGWFEIIDKNILKTNRMKNLTILIVEDDDSTQLYLRELLKNKCKRLLYANTGIKAVELCKKEDSIGLILMDIKLPGLDGYEATRQIREFNQDVTIIAQTAFALIGDRSKVIEAGCDDYISKPVDEKELYKLINRYL
jgi:CheY-like chemotaxis protein